MEGTVDSWVSILFWVYFLKNIVKVEFKIILKDLVYALFNWNNLNIYIII